MEIYWITKENYSKFRRDKTIANGYCLTCQKPIMRHIYCITCLHKLYIFGFDKRIKFGEIGLLTVNYQQHLHRKFFGCNAPVKYRGDKPNRKRNTLTQQDIDYAVNKLHYALNNQDKRYTYLYNNIKNEKNALRRILYNTLLYYIVYLTTNKFNDEVHFYTSMTYAVINELHRLNIKHKKLVNIKGVRRRKPRHQKKLVQDLNIIIHQLIDKVL